MFYDNTKELEHIAELEEQLADAQRALDVEREKVKEYMTNYVPLKALEDVEAQLATLQAQLAEIEQILCIESGKTTVDKVRDLHQSFKQVWNSYQGAGNDLFDMQAQLRRVEGERDDEKTAYKKLSERWNKDSLDLQAKDAEIEFVNKTAADFQALWREACDQREQKDAEIAAWKLELGRMRANHPENGCYAALPKLRSQVDTLTHTNARLREALKTIEAIICDKKLCGHFLAEEIREQTQQALADTEGQEGA